MLCEQTQNKKDRQTTIRKNQEQRNTAQPRLRLRRYNKSKLKKIFEGVQSTLKKTF